MARFRLLLPLALGLLAGAAACAGEDVEDDDATDAEVVPPRTGSSSSSGSPWPEESSSSSGAPDAGSSSGGSSSGGSSSSSSSSGGEGCADPNDANDTDDPTTLPPTSDEITGTSSIQGVLSSPTDVDAYRIFVRDGSGTLVPYAATNAANAELCLYLQCANSAQTLNVSCDQGTVDTDGTNKKGCCAANAVKVDYTCSWQGAGNDSVNAYLVIRSEAEQCVDYTISYSFKG